MEYPAPRLTPVAAIPEGKTFGGSNPERTEELDELANQIKAHPGQAYHALALPNTKESYHFISNFRIAMKRRGVTLISRSDKGYIHVFLVHEGAK